MKNTLSDNQLSVLLSATERLRILYKELDTYWKNSYVPESPNLTLGLQVAGLEEALRYLDVVYQHHRLEHF